MLATAIQTVALADKLDQSPTARDGSRPDLDLVVDLDVDLDLDISGVATSSSAPRRWTGKTSEPSWRKNSPSPRPRRRPSPSITKGMHSHCPQTSGTAVRRFEFHVVCHSHCLSLSAGMPPLPEPSRRQQKIGACRLAPFALSRPLPRARR